MMRGVSDKSLPRDSGSIALRNEDTEAAKAALEQLDQLRKTLELEYTIRIVSRPGERSGVWRVPDINQAAKNYYVIVEALDPSGDTLEVLIENEETGSSDRVRLWGVRVDEATFNAVKSDKQDDGIIENDRFGFKRRGYLKPAYEMPTSGGTITRWDRR